MLGSSNMNEECQILMRRPTRCRWVLTPRGAEVHRDLPPTVAMNKLSRRLRSKNLKKSNHQELRQRPSRCSKSHRCPKNIVEVVKRVTIVTTAHRTVMRFLFQRPTFVRHKFLNRILTNRAKSYTGLAAMVPKRSHTILKASLALLIHPSLAAQSLAAIGRPNPT